MNGSRDRRLLVRSCGNELGFATWEAFDFERNTWLCEAFENREAAELWLSGEEVDTCFELDDQLVQSTKRMAGTRRQHGPGGEDRRNP